MSPASAEAASETDLAASPDPVAVDLIACYKKV